MAKDTLTFALGGRIEIAEFADGIAAFRRLVAALTPKAAGVTWVVDDLQPGSAVVTLRGESSDPQAVERIINDYEKIGSTLECHEELMWTRPRVLGAANAVRSLAAAAEYVRFQTPENDYTIYDSARAHARPLLTVSIGSVTGKIQTLSNRSGLRFNLYDSLHDKAVTCYLDPGRDEMMREAWGSRAKVTGKVSREERTGQPVAIRQIVDVTIIENVETGSYRQARGAVEWHPGAKSPEEAIRELRDA